MERVVIKNKQGHMDRIRKEKIICKIEGSK